MAADSRVSWRIVEASITGPHHVRAALPNQDAADHRLLGPGMFAIAIADGAGSAARADEGSQLAVAAALDTADEMIEAGRPATLLEWQSFASHYARNSLRRFDRALRGVADPPVGVTSDRADFATTLLAVVAEPPWFVCFSIGDGFLVVDRQPGGPHLVVPPPVGREFMGETVFLTSTNRVKAQRLEVLHDPHVQGLALCTDGLIEGLLNYARCAGGAAHPFAPPETVAYFDYVRDPANGAEGLRHTLASPGFAATSGDDKTIAMVVRR